MANNTPWSERSGTERRRTYGRYGLLYGAIGIVALALGWLPIAIVFLMGAIALGIAWMATPADETPPRTPRSRPDWMVAMDDPNAPDLSRPEYRTRPDSSADAAGDEPTGMTVPSAENTTGASPMSGRSPFDRPGPDAEGPDDSAGPATGPSTRQTP